MSKADKEMDRWAKEVKRGAVTLAILSLLDKEPAYGYELVKRLEQKVSFLQLEQGTVYPLLRRMEKRGLLVSEWDYDDPTKPKKYYGLTSEGRNALQMMAKTWNILSGEMKEITMEAGYQ
ncbi:MAG: PadR family transcriptional regulator [Candidatus Thorarchaeota archaeon]|nr:PadR family transcriptional regulator [Candidatus Thorarchaeota archaeon]